MTKPKDIDLWISGTEEPDWDTSTTDEGGQEMASTETDFRLREQLGSVVTDDYVFDDEISDDERMIINMGPQHPSTHGVLRLQIELEGEMIRRTKPVIGYLHTGMEKTAEGLTFMQGPNQRHPHGLSRLVPQRALLLDGGRTLAWDRGAAQSPHDPGPADRAQPDLVPPGRNGHQRHGHRRPVDHDLWLPRP